jgi:hypothetical protein
MTIKKYSRNRRFDDYEDRPSKPKHKDRSEKRIRNALRTNDVQSLSSLDEDWEEFFEEDEEWRR